jgi:hypothetical protein
MLTLAPLVPAATTCQPGSAASAAVGLILFLGLIGGVIALAIANSNARGRLAAANAELAHLRPENARLHQSIAGLGGSPASAGTGAAPDEQAVPPQWSPDPSGRHQLRYWDGAAWSHHVADGGVMNLDHPV